VLTLPRTAPEGLPRLRFSGTEPKDMLLLTRKEGRWNVRVGQIMYCIGALLAGMQLVKGSFLSFLWHRAAVRWNNKSNHETQNILLRLLCGKKYGICFHTECDVASIFDLCNTDKFLIRTNLIRTNLNKICP